MRAQTGHLNSLSGSAVEEGIAVGVDKVVAAAAAPEPIEVGLWWRGWGGCARSSEESVEREAHGERGGGDEWGWVFLLRELRVCVCLRVCLS